MAISGRSQDVVFLQKTPVANFCIQYFNGLKTLYYKSIIYMMRYPDFVYGLSLWGALGSNVKAKDNTEDSVLHYAVRTNNPIEILQYLVNEGACSRHVFILFDVALTVNSVNLMVRFLVGN